MTHKGHLIFIENISFKNIFPIHETLFFPSKYNCLLYNPLTVGFQSQ